MGSPGRLTARELAAWRGFLRIHARVFRELDDELAERHGLPLAQYDVLLRLSEQPEGRLRMSDLAAVLLRPRSSLSNLADLLEARGLVRREPSPVDARSYEAVLTDEGLAALRDAQSTHLASVRERFLDPLTPQQLEQLAGAWAAIDPAVLEPMPDETKKAPNGGSDPEAPRPDSR